MTVRHGASADHSHGHDHAHSHSKVFTYGLGRVEDLAGLVIVAIIAFSAVVAGYESILKLIHLEAPTHLATLAVAAVVGFLGNEIVAQMRIAAGRRLGSAALLADGMHARVDGITSLIVLLGAVGTYIGLPWLDPVAGLLITIMILGIVRDSATAVFRRLLDGIEPQVIDTIQHTAASVDGVTGVADVRARWVGHRILADVAIAVAGSLSVAEAHAVALQVEHALIHAVPHLGEAVVQVDPAERSGQAFHPHRTEGHHPH